jgi:hypothetical protein
VTGKFPCPVCGYLVFAEPPGSYDICEVCGWEDDALQLEFATSLAGGANSVTLADAQASFLKAADRLGRKRPGTTMPRVRDPDWRPIDLTRDRFAEWNDEMPERAPEGEEELYYWRTTFWRRDRAR